MAKKWSEVASSPQYMALSPQEREEARNEYFNHVVAPNVVNQEELAEVRRAFDTDTAPKQQQQGRASGGPVHPAPPVDQAAIARQVYDDSPWYQRPFIAAGAEMNRIGRGLQQLVTDKDSAKGRALQQRIDADAPMQEGVNGVSGFIGRVLPYAATAVMGGPEAAVLGRLGQAGTLARFATKAGVAAAEGAGYGALGETRTGENRLANAGYGALGGVAARGALGAARGVTSGLARRGDPLLQADIAIAQREGIPLHVSQVAQSTPARTMASMAKYLPFSGADVAARNQQNAWNRALTRHVGDATDRLDDSWIAKQKQALGEAYDTIWNRNDVTISPETATRMHHIVQNAYRDLGTDGGKVVENQFGRILDDIAQAGQEGTISGRNYQRLARTLAQVQPGTSVGNYVGRLRKELIGDAENSITPSDMALLQQTNQKYNNFKTLEKLLTRQPGARADIAPAALWSAVNARGPKATQEFRELAKVGQNLLKDPIPDSGTMGRLVSLNLFGGGGALAGGIVPALTALAGGATVGRALNSPFTGNWLARNAGKPDFFANLLAAQGAKGGLRKGLGRAGQITTMAGSKKLLQEEIP
ncbi:hypothetical protein FG476_04080 [Xylella fastidiosa subsp. multiplex]|uniref:Uncharacterized protein n=1 Tax=Xylella fastidiosa subsp. multiplex TaxID=644357 RepID=A0A9Q4QSA4_XYLFS|nr:hypothetical protein [Xylella fastidiosa]MBE0269668.1 hypothetical protein [Xylella fastidiosa subsp. multiplex]MBE0276090.1 hypothetical protein [Xylella fastidiosa subsp. multiplex]MBE0278310.1 hypothetical protein [Xylella fastidiosa subsp. multiplex]MBE0282854.1 hypothetical protein [Xylella fastidiosa subsp. multiplex]MRT52776.1 hypothetical protein [Xylella fastidiosa subsp. multiplex]